MPIFRDDDGKDFLGLKRPDFTKIGATIDKVAEPVKTFFSKNPGFEKNPLNFGISTVHNDVSTSHEFFKEFLMRIFDFNKKEFSVVPKLISDTHKEALLYSEDLDDDVFDLNLLSVGYYKKLHGLNIHPKNCPNIRKVFFQSEKSTVEEFLSLISEPKYKELMNYFAEKHSNNDFKGKNDKETWLYLGHSKSINERVEDLYNLIETVNFDYKYGLIGEKSKEKVVLLHQIKLALINFHFENYVSLIGRRFLSFINFLLEKRNKIVKEIKGKNVNKDLKNFLAIGSHGLNKDLLATFFLSVIGANQEVDTYDSSILIAFTGDEDEIKNVDFYLDDKKVGTISIERFIKLNTDDLTNDKEFNDICYGTNFKDGSTF
jgi:hypothetical protein